MKTFSKRMLSMMLTLSILLSMAVFTTVDSYAFTDGTYDNNYVYLCNFESGSRTSYTGFLGSYNPCADFGAKEGSRSVRLWHDGETNGGFESLVGITLNQNHPWSNFTNWYFHAWVYFSHNVPSGGSYLQFNFCHTGNSNQDGKNFNVPIGGLASGWHRIMFRLNGSGASYTNAVPAQSQFNCMRIGVNGGILGNAAFSGGLNVAIDDMYLVRSETWQYATYLQRLSGSNVLSAEGGYVRVTGATYGGTSITSTSTAAETLTGLQHSFSDANSSSTSRSVTVPYNTSITMQAYANTGYRFNGWGDNSTNPRTWSITSPNMNYGARFIPHVVHIVYNGNGATGGSTSTTQNVAYNNTSAERTTFRSNGFTRSYTVTYNGNEGSPSKSSDTASYSFSMWALNSTSGAQYSAGAVIPDKLSTTDGANINVYAIWTGGTCTSATASRSGYTFAGWYDAPSGGNLVANSGASFTPGSTRTLYAHWTENGPSFGDRSVSCTYSGSNQDISFTAASGGFGSYTYTKQSGSDKLSIPSSTSSKIRVAGGTSVGTYSARIRATNSGGSKYAEGTVTVAVGKASGSISCGTDTMILTYGGSNGTRSASGTGTVSVSSNNTNVATVSISNGTITVKPVGAGSATITVSCAASTNYNAPTNKTFTVQVNKANFSDPTFANTTRTYNGSAQSPTVSNAQGATITYSTGGSYSSTMPSWTNAGTYTVYWKATKANYNDRSGSFTFKINPATGNISLNKTSMSLSYPSTGTISVSSYHGGSITASSSDSNTATVSVSGTTITVTPKKTGSVTITITSGATTNYNAKSATCSVKIENGTIATPTFNNTTTTYNGKEQTATLATNSTGATITYSTSSGGTYSANMPKWTNAGTYTIYWKAAKTYYSGTSGSFTFTINKAGGTMTINSTAQMSLTYPNTDTTRTVSSTHGGTVSVSSNNTSVATVSISGNTITVTAGTTAGSATITVTSAETGNHYAASTTFTVAVSKGTLANPSVSSNTHTYDGASHGATVTAGTSSTIKFGTVSGTYNLASVPTYKNAGTYTIYWQQTKAGYNDKTGSFQITINQREVTLTWGTASFTYNGSSHVPTCTLGNIVSGDTVTVTVTGAQTNAGTYTATASSLNNANYKLPSSNTKSFTISNASQSAPTGLGAVDETYAAQSNGQITGTTTAMEYKLSTADSYTACSGSTVTDLAPGTYYVRYKAKTNYNASDDTTVVIAAGRKIVLTVTSNDNSFGTVTGSGSFNYNATQTITATPATGYEFVSWSDGNTSASRTLTLTGDATYTATFRVLYYTLTWDANGGVKSGTYTPDGTTAFGTALVAPTVTKKGSTFMGWSPAVPSTMPNGNATYVAQWQKTVPTITVATGTGAMGQTADVDVSINPLTNVSTMTFVITYNTEQFQTVPTYTLNNLGDNVNIQVDNSAAGTVTVNLSCAAGLDNGGSILTLHFDIPESLLPGNYDFISTVITECSDPTEPFTNTSVAAVGGITVTPGTFGVTLNYNGGSSTSTLDQYTYGSGVLLPSAENDNLKKLGYVFLGWYDNADFDGNAFTAIPTNVFGAKTYYAKWINAAYTISEYDNSVEMQAARDEVAAIIEAILADETLTDQEREEQVNETLDQAHLELGVFNVAFQTPSSATIDSETLNIRFLSTIDDYTKYSVAGFEVTFISPKGGTKTLYFRSKLCYESIVTGGSGIDVTVEPSYFDEYSNYFITATFNGIPKSWFTDDYQVSVRAYAVYVGTDDRVLGVTKTKYLKDLVNATV